MGRLSNKVALVSGAGGMKGRAVARLLAEEGAAVLITDINEAGLASNVEALAALGVEQLRLDVTQEEDWKSVVAWIKQRHGQLDILVNSARTFTNASGFDEISLESWREQMAVNLDGAFLGIKHCFPLLSEGAGGSIVNVVSLSAAAPFVPSPPYSAAHAALLNLSRAAGVIGADMPNIVRCNALLCGMSAHTPVGDVYEVARRVVPLKRPGSPEDIAHAILWFASDESKYVTGASVTLDGGFTAGLRFS